MKKLISWNVNGLRACVGKGFLDFFKEADADVFCIQESKLQEGQSFRGIFSIGIMQRRRGIPERLYSVRRSRFLYHTDWGLRSMTMRAV